MRRYILFIGYRYYPAGVHDYAGDYDNISECLADAKNNVDEKKWYHIIDTKEKLFYDSEYQEWKPLKENDAKI